jgi:hypothetical protein
MIRFLFILICVVAAVGVSRPLGDGHDEHYDVGMWPSYSHRGPYRLAHIFGFTGYPLVVKRRLPRAQTMDYKSLSSTEMAPLRVGIQLGAFRYEGPINMPPMALGQQPGAGIRLPLGMMNAQMAPHLVIDMQMHPVAVPAIPAPLPMENDGVQEVVANPLAMLEDEGYRSQ